MHRLVRISPYDSNARRHTSFAIGLGLSGGRRFHRHRRSTKADVRIDTYRSSGAGGQHVNTTDSAVRITHIPTGIVVACQAGALAAQEPRQGLGDAARAPLRGGAEEARGRRPAPTEASKTDIGWGHQIRSYVLQPYQLVKDLRTGVESTSPQDVLDGDLDDFMEASLAQRIEGVTGQPVADLD